MIFITEWFSFCSNLVVFILDIGLLSIMMCLFYFVIGQIVMCPPHYFNEIRIQKTLLFSISSAVG